MSSSISKMIRALSHGSTTILLTGGILISIVPAYEFLFSDHDRDLGYYRRYTGRRVDEALPAGVRRHFFSYLNTLLFSAAILARLMWPIGQRLGDKKGVQQPSLVSRPVEGLLLASLAIEHRLIDGGIRLLFGLALLHSAVRHPANWLLARALVTLPRMQSPRRPPATEIVVARVGTQIKTPEGVYS